MSTRSPLLVEGPWHHKSCAKLEVTGVVTSSVTLSAAQAPQFAVSVCYFFMDAHVPFMHLIAGS